MNETGRSLRPHQAPAPLPPSPRPTGRRTGRPAVRLAPAERLALVTAAVLFASGLFHLGVFAVAGGPWNGPVSWRKPATFGLSFGLTLAALTWVTSYVRTGARTRAALLVLLAADSVLEVAGITLQAWRRVPSHLDMETPFDSAVSMALAAGGALLVVILTRFAVAAFRAEPSGPAGMALAVRAGFAVLLVALAAGAAMIARGVVLTRTGHQSAAYASTAPLKPLHGVGLHAVLALPALAWLLARTRLDAARRVRIVAAATGCYLLAVVVTAVWAALSY
ncbi:hypothetical protein [Streptomyces sp. cg36]|uniref:hypothetical protein n=1 Tax=Streptomyces sp. cg36 TaxID=3238798 RepID=UPI0034E2E2B2